MVQFACLLDSDKVIPVAVVVIAQDMVVKDLQPMHVRRVGKSIRDLIFWLH